MKFLLRLSFAFLILSATGFAQTKAPILLEDHFDREETNPEREQIGNGWKTNSRSRAKGEKQVDMVDGAMHITRADIADHGVSVTHEVAFKDATIELRFKIGKQDDLGINIADMKEKSVHAGHICVARIRAKKLEISDLKTGQMKLEHRKARLAKTMTPEMQKQIATRKKNFPLDLDTKKWHQLSVQIKDQTMTVKIDGQQVGQFESEGIGHATKSRLRLSVNKSAWVDDVVIHGT